MTDRALGPSPHAEPCPKGEEHGVFTHVYVQATEHTQRCMHCGEVRPLQTVSWPKVAVVVTELLTPLASCSGNQPPLDLMLPLVEAAMAGLRDLARVLDVASQQAPMTTAFNVASVFGNIRALRCSLEAFQAVYTHPSYGVVTEGDQRHMAALGLEAGAFIRMINELAGGGSALETVRRELLQ